MQKNKGQSRESHSSICVKNYIPFFVKAGALTSQVGF